jgi:hypothetical protein
MGAADDGRLELDDLGSVMDHASSLAPSAADDLLEGNDAPTWHERLESRGITPWLRRHRLVLAVGAVAVVAVGAVGTALVRSQPPPVDPTITATVADALSNGLATQIPGGTYDGFTAVAVKVEPRAGEAITVLGITGPGIRASRAVRGATEADDGVEDVFLAPGCDDPRSFIATFDDYRLQVRRTDTYGRTTAGTLALPSAIAAQLADSAVENCFRARVTEVVTVSAIDIRPDVARRTITAGVTIRNGLDRDLLVQGVSSGSTVLDSFADPADLVAGADTTQQVRLTLVDCGPQQDVITQPSSDASSAQGPVDLNFYVTPLGGGPSGADLTLAWSAADRARIVAATRAMCAGGPGATARVLSASPAPAAVSQAYGFTGPNDGVVLRMRVEVTSSAPVLLTDGSYPYSAQITGPRTVSTVSSVPRGGRSVVTVDWAAQCNATLSPPQIWLTATSGGRTYPYRDALDELVLAHAYSAACPGNVPADLRGFGWPGP